MNGAAQSTLLPAVKPPRRELRPSGRRTARRTLRSILRGLSQRIDELERDCIAAIRGEVPDYGRIRDPVFIDDMGRMIRVVAELWYGTYLSRRLPPAAAFEAISEIARHRVHQGIPIEAMLQAFELGAGVVWRKIVDAAARDPEVESEILHRISPLVFAVLQKSSQAISRAYLDELGTNARWRARIQEELAGLVMGGEENQEAFSRRLLALGLDPQSGVRALAFRSRTGHAKRLSSGVIADAAADALGIDSSRLVGAMHEGDVIVWVPAPDEESSPETELVRACDRILSRERRLAGAGVGLRFAGPSGWRRSAEQALRALSSAEAAPRRGRVHTYSRIAVYDLALGLPTLRDVLAARIARLEANPALLETLETYFDEGRHAKATAARLGLHPSTLTYRLRRAQKILGGSLDDPDGSLAVALALKLRRLQRSGGSR